MNRSLSQSKLRNLLARAVMILWAAGLAHLMHAAATRCDGLVRACDSVTEISLWLKGRYQQHQKRAFRTFLDTMTNATNTQFAGRAMLVRLELLDSAGNLLAPLPRHGVPFVMNSCSPQWCMLNPWPRKVLDAPTQGVNRSANEDQAEGRGSIPGRPHAEQYAYRRIGNAARARFEIGTVDRCWFPDHFIFNPKTMDGHAVVDLNQG